MSEIAWWKTGVIYQIYPRSFQDTTGNGIGDLQGIINRLDYLNNGTPHSLGIDAIWISPFYPSPMADFGYDVADYVDVHSMFGDLKTFDRLVEEAHKRNIKVIIDFVPNHTSDAHAWFEESGSSRDNPKADWYIWKDPKPDGSLPNNWGAIFGGPAWTWNENRQQYYFHQFHQCQPDLNWRNPGVRAAMHDVLRFWMARGVDGFRMDVLHIIWKHPDMPDQPPRTDLIVRGEEDIYNTQQQIYSQDYDGVHERIREIRQVLNEHETVGIGEIWLPIDRWVKYYGETDDELHMPFNFALIAADDFTLKTTWSAESIREIVDRFEAAIPEHGYPNWVLGNHDVPRLASRVGEAQARTAAMLLLTLRGTPTIYNGDEIGMVNGVITPEQVQDPQGVRLGIEHSRDIARTPLHWNASNYAGFSTVEPWLPIGPDHHTKNVSQQLLDDNSMLSLYRRLIWARKDSLALSIGEYEPVDSPQGTYVYFRRHESEEKLIALNFTDNPQQIKFGRSGELQLSTHSAQTGNTVDGTLQLAPNEGVIIALL